ncbi:PIN-like domain-containing protein [Microbacterium phyllosphaerae]|uniref:PIN-like domain-containing protein n=1 Tax=Microbacterium phyllosphaerae TaxID=124798 RepID=UPI003D65F71D
MRDVFPAYYKPTKDEMSDLWENALVVLDTNALLNLFRYTNSTREAFLKVLSAKRERLWLPHQVGLEFHRNRLGVIDAQSSAFNDLITKANAALASVTNDVGKLRNHPTLNLDDLRSTVSEAVATIESKIEATREKYQTDVLDAARHDETTDVITDLYAGRVGAPYDDDKSLEIFKAGTDRYDREIPPGYKDAKKPEPDRFGDLILWFQILDKAEADSAAVIFVGDDQKEDWWREFKGKKIGPRVELIDEFRKRSGKRIYFLTPYALMELAREYDDDSITSDAVQEVAEVSKAQSRVNEYFHGSPITPISHDEEDFGSLGTSELELAIRRLTLARDREEALLRTRLATMRELDAQGEVESDAYMQTQRLLNRHRAHVAGFSNALKEAQWEHMQRRRAHAEASWSNTVITTDQIEMARVLLERSVLVPPSGAATWKDTSELEIAEILERVKAGVAPPSFSEVLQTLGDLYGQRRPNFAWDDVRPGDRIDDTALPVFTEWLRTNE